MKKKTCKIGEIIKLRGRRYKCLEDEKFESCERCDLRNTNECLLIECCNYNSLRRVHFELVNDKKIKIMKNIIVKFFDFIKVLFKVLKKFIVYVFNFKVDE